MKLPLRYILILSLLVAFVCNAQAQVDDICAESGNTPSLDSPFARVPYIYGRINLVGFEQSQKPPIVTITMVDGQQNTNRWTVGRSGNYCFKTRTNGTTLIVEVNGVEAARKALTSFGPAQQREDFEIRASDTAKTSPPGVVSAKFSHPTNPATIELYEKAAEAENEKDVVKEIGFLKEIIAVDPEDFIAWAKLGQMYFEKEQLKEALAAFKKSLELKIEYTPAWINVGMIRMAQKEYVAAIEIYKHALTLEPKSARIYQLLGEAYLQNKQGTYGAQVLNEAIRLDPIGMAECHLQLAHLYQLAKANKLATKEYKAFLGKVPSHPDKAKFEKFIKDNPE